MKFNPAILQHTLFNTIMYFYVSNIVHFPAYQGLANYETRRKAEREKGGWEGRQQAGRQKRKERRKKRKEERKEGKKKKEEKKGRWEGKKDSKEIQPRLYVGCKS